MTGRSYAPDRSAAGHAAAGSPGGTTRLDLRLVPPALAAWIAAGWALGALPRTSFIAASAGALLGALLLRESRRTPAYTVCAASILCAAGGVSAAGLRVHALGAGPLRSLAAAHAEVSLRLTVASDPVPITPKPGRIGRLEIVLLRARVDEVQSARTIMRVRQPVLVLAPRAAWAPLLPSQHLLVHGRLAPARRGDLVAAVLLARGPPYEVAEPSRVQRAAGRLRAGLRAASAPLPRAERGLLPALVDGDVSQLDRELSADFRTTGMTHLTAVSGSNTAILLSAVLLLARRLRAGRRLTAVVAVASLLGFVVLARPEPSVLRAAVMGVIAVVALASGRRRAALPALAVAVLVLVLFVPELARSAGFALSVLATAGLLVLAPPLRDRMARRLPLPLAEAFAVPAAAQVACAPVIAGLSAQVSIVAVPANLLAAPAVAPATVLGVLAAVTAPVCLPIARLLARVAAVPTGWLATVARHGADVPAASLPWLGGTTGALTLLAATVVALAVASRRAGRGLVSATAAGALAAALSLHVVGPSWPPTGWLIVMCDVGQGDALVLAAGPGTAVVVDAGPDPALVDRCLRDLAVRRISLVVLTHLHADHVEGLPGVLRGREVAGIELGPLDEPVPEHARVERWAAVAGVPVTRSGPGERRAAAGLEWDVLAPARAFHGTDSDPNNSSVVLRVRAGGVTLLLTGDVEPDAQRALLEGGVDLRADVLKVPHHGSDHQDPRFFAAVGARLAVTSVGAQNSYGHPSPRTLARLREAGAQTLRTDLDGDVALNRDGGRLVAHPRHRAPGPRPPASTAARLACRSAVQGPAAPAGVPTASDGASAGSAGVGLVAAALGRIAAGRRMAAVCTASPIAMARAPP